MSKETWTEWILSSYSDSVSPSVTDVSTLSAEPESTTVRGSSSPYGPYTKTGRSGAGNFVWQSELPHDLEGKRKSSLAGRRKASLGIEAEERRRLGSKKRPADIYTGRGGAGNAAPLTAGSYGSRDSPRSPSWPVSPQEGPPAQVRSASLGVTHHGRGGAGNVAASTALAREGSSEREEDDERRMEEDLRERSEAEVGSLLKPPEEVFLAAGGFGRRRESGVGVFG